MRKGVVQLRLDPNRCDRCGRCVKVCEPGALKIGTSYIYVDWRVCDECYLCVKACDRGAIVRRESPRKAGPAKRSAAAGRPSRADVAPARPKPAKRQVAGQAQPGMPTSWTMAEAGAILAVVLAAFLGKDALLASPDAGGLSADAVLLRVAVLSGFYVVQLAVLWFLAYRRGLRLPGAFAFARTDSSASSKLSSAGLVLLLVVGTRVAGWIYGVVVMALGWNPPERANAALTEIFGSGMGGLLLTVMLVVLVGPLIEEMVFRGVLLRAFASRWSLGVALSAQAGLFAAYHFTAWLFIPTFLLGLATGWLAFERRSLWPAVALHVLYNAVPVVIAFALPAG